MSDRKAALVINKATIEEKTDQLKMKAIPYSSENSSTSRSIIETTMSARLDHSKDNLHDKSSSHQKVETYLSKVISDTHNNQGVEICPAVPRTSNAPEDIDEQNPKIEMRNLNSIVRRNRSIESFESKASIISMHTASDDNNSLSLNSRP